jgi:hypothetical protein
MVRVQGGRTRAAARWWRGGRLPAFVIGISILGEERREEERTMSCATSRSMRDAPRVLLGMRSACIEVVSTQAQERRRGEIIPG